MCYNIITWSQSHAAKVEQYVLTANNTSDDWLSWQSTQVSVKWRLNVIRQWQTTWHRATTKMLQATKNVPSLRRWPQAYKYWLALSSTSSGVYNISPWTLSPRTFALPYKPHLTPVFHVVGRTTCCNYILLYEWIFYRAMHFRAKRGIAIACRLSVRPSVRLWRWWIVIT